MQITTHRAGVPSWIDLPTPQPAAAAEFYAAVFGWEVKSPDADGYRMAYLRGQPVAGIARQDRAGRPAWLTYVTVEDADDAAAAVRKADGSVLQEPAEVSDAGRSAVFADPTGGVFAVWQPRGRQGAGLFQEPGAVRRFELETRQPMVALAFYHEVFGWEPTLEQVSGTYLFDFHRYDETVAGLMPMGKNIPADVPPNWMVYFDVADPDVTTRLVRDLGGEVYVEPTTVAVGRFAVLGDPHGAVFGILTMSC